MDRRVVWAESAWRDLEQIADYISRDSAHYAGSFVREIREAARSLSKFSERGRVVPELESSSLREIFVQSYRIIYSTKGNDLALLGVIHGARNLKHVWESRRRPHE